MLRRKYDVQMRTPLGSRSGTLEVEIEKGRVTGSLDVLKHAEPIEGSIDEAGTCCLRGKMITLMSTIPYTATGQMTMDSLELFLRGGRNVFHMTGTPVQER